ncbi:MFS transporter [Paraburkholderia sp. DHOC27]|uniref:MFS transporter n=1 Tax=Paraburkholderia sp. DHOC27 TaxID=2303330 RepID=UPI000E3E0C5F|nr:MFS transporter [Paraburkholderia sp. DHOC27]RFU45020.1 MFS transporter [Paraburkholderia sp. DHOC27]
MHRPAESLPDSSPTPGLTRTIATIVTGNGFVAYDFTVYSFSAVLIGQLFFPSANPAASLLLSLATFGAGFVMRPLGALWIGRLSDQRGRKAGMSVALMLMTVGTWMMACLPTYASIGFAAPLLMVVARLLQGFAAGGEIGPASASLMESVPYHRRCFMVSWRGASQGAAALVAALVGAATVALLSPAALKEWGWRVPFFIGGLIGPVGWLLRRQMLEAVPATPRERLSAQLVREHARPLVLGVLMMAAPSVSIYVTVFYMPAYLVGTLHRAATLSLLTACSSGLVILIVTPLVGRLADRRASRKTLQYAALAIAIGGAWPAFWWLTRGVSDLATLGIITVYVAFAVNNAGAGSVLMMEAFPQHRRAAALAVIYSLGVVLFGGFSPFIVSWLIHVSANAMMPAWYLMAANGLSLGALYLFPERLAGASDGSVPAGTAHR